LGATYDSRRDLYHPQFGEHNGVRLPTFFQLDLRVARSFNIAETDLELSFEVQNLTNKTNVEELIYSADYAEQGAIVGLPILPVLGLRWSL
jgi:outer membrane receptor protein involved in Fe transport